MCDTLVAVGAATADGSTLLAKNSDREPNEAQVLTYVPPLEHARGSVVQCTYLTIPQVAETHEVLLCRPFWMWGAEMGVNGHGVAIGNEAVFTREPYERGPALTGMDLLRLALERSSTAGQALEVIIGLLRTYGQGGNCGFRHKLYYHNSFILADPSEAWVLETAGRHWAAERVRGVRSISNGLTIDEPDLASAGQDRDRKGFARRYADPFMTRMDGCRPRQRRSTDLLLNPVPCGPKSTRPVDVPAMMAVLRDHGAEAAGDPLWNPGRGWLMDKVCVHASLGPTRPSQSVGSLVAHLRPECPTVWVTGTSAPCTGLFRPVYLRGAGLPDLGPAPCGTHDRHSPWWAHERLHRAVVRDYPARLSVYRDERDALEGSFLAESATVAGADPAAAAALTESCFRRAAEATARWTEQVEAIPVRNRPPRLFTVAWNILDRQAGLRAPRTGSG